MKSYHVIILTLILSFFLASCAHYPPDRYNTQVGAAVGAGAGALLGQAIGGNTQSTLIGLAAGTILGALVGNAVDQDYQAARDAARQGKPVIYYDNRGHAVEAIPEGVTESNCQRVRKRMWEDGRLVKETVEEICGSPAPPVVRYYPAPPPPPVVQYYPAPFPPPVVQYYPAPFPPPASFSFYYGRPYYRGYHSPYHGGWHRW